MFGSDRSAEECRRLCKAQEIPHTAIGAAYELVCVAITNDTLSEYDGFEILGYLNDAAHAMRIASIKAKLELARYEKASTKPIYDTVEVPEPAKPEPPKVKAAPPPKPEPPADDGLPPNDPAIDEGDVEVTDEPVEPPKPPPAVKAKAPKPPGAVEQLVMDIRAELARFKDWGDYAAIFFDNKATDVDVLAGKVSDVRILSAILTALKAKPAGKAK